MAISGRMFIRCSTLCVLIACVMLSSAVDNSAEEPSPTPAVGQPRNPVASKTESKDGDTTETSPAKTGSVPQKITEAKTAEIAELIKNLGHRSFTVRERAETELIQLGIDAFDQVHVAMGHPDLEIARRAQYLVRSLEITWSDPEYSKEVRSILERYGSLNENQRSTRVEKLGKLKDLDAVAALCRISRLDISEKLSKQAALANALHYSLAALPEFAEKIPAIIDRELGSSKRTGPQWLQVYRESLTDLDQATKGWHDLVQQEMKTYAVRPERTSRPIIQDLIRWEVDKLRSLDRQEEALAEMRNIIKISNVSTSEIADITTWLLDRQGYPIVDELAEYHADKQDQPAEDNKITGRFAEDPRLLYLLAESHLMQKKLDSASAIAKQAFLINPEDYESHYFTGALLHQRGLFRWCEMEYRQVFEGLEPLQIFARFARTTLAGIYHDTGNHTRAAELLNPLVEAIESAIKGIDRNRFREVETLETYDGIMARQQLYFARNAQKKGDIESAKSHLRKAIQFDYQEADTLIAIYKLSGDPSWKKFADLKHELAVKEYSGLAFGFVKEVEKLIKQPGGYYLNDRQRRTMSGTLNGFAWVVGNTKGDLEAAIRASHASLDLYPNQGAYLDTLSHCYYAIDDYENAVKYQTEAVKQMPHSPLIRSQYLFFIDQYNKHGGNVTLIELAPKLDDNFPAEAASEESVSEDSPSVENAAEDGASTDSESTDNKKEGE